MVTGGSCIRNYGTDEIWPTKIEDVDELYGLKILIKCLRCFAFKSPTFKSLNSWGAEESFLVDDDNMYPRMLEQQLLVAAFEALQLNQFIRGGNRKALVEAFTQCSFFRMMKSNETNLTIGLVVKKPFRISKILVQNYSWLFLGQLLPIPLHPHSLNFRK